MTTSTNFEFMRAKCAELADEAAEIEGLVHRAGPQATNLLCSFGEKLLQLFVLANDGSVNRADSSADGETIEYGQLLRQCENKSLRWHVPEPQRILLKRLLSEGNKAKHRLNARHRSNALSLVQDAWAAAGWVWKQLQWGNAAEQFVEPPKGGREFDEARRQKLEALKHIAELERSCDVSGWICKDQRNLSAPANFVGREFVFGIIKRFLECSESRVLLIQGQPGRGKTAIIQKFVSDGFPSGITPFVFCFKDQSSQGEPKQWVRHFYASLVERWQLTPPDRSIKEADLEELVQQLRNRIAEVAEKHRDQRMLFVVDAVDEAGPAEKSVVSFLKSEFPDTVQVVVTARPDHVSFSSSCTDGSSRNQVLDLDDPDRWNNHQADGRRFVTATMPNLEPVSIKEVVQLGNGNFLALLGICRELRDVPAPDIAHHLRELSELKALGKDLNTELFERTWRRLERLDADSLDTTRKVAALLATARSPLSQEFITDFLKLRPADWIKLKQHLGEYLVESPRNPPFMTRVGDADGSQDNNADSESVTVFRLYHETFQAFVRQYLKAEFKPTGTQLAKFCRERVKNPTDCFESWYALKFTVQHLIEAEHAEHWNELIQLLTDLDFIEARFTFGQGYDLLEDYELALRKHPDTHDQLRRRDEQDEELQKWVKAMVDYSRQCADIRGRYARKEIPDAVAEIQNLTFPEPIDTSATIKDMKAAEASSQRRRHTSDAAVSLFEFRAFIRSQFDDLNELPRATFGIASNCSTKSAVAEAARRVEAKHTQVPILRREPRIDLSNQSSLVTRIGYGNVPDEQFIEWMTADARIGVGYGCDGCLDFIWDLRSGRRLPTDDGEFRILGVTLDGRYVATSEIIWIDKLCVANRIALLNIRSGEVWRELEFALKEPNVEYSNGDVEYPFGITPDGSLFVFRSGDELVVWETESKELSQRIDLEGIDPQALVLCSSGCVVAVFHEEEGNSRWTFFDLLSGTRLDQNEEWFAADFRVAHRLRDGKRTAGGALRLVVEGADSWPQKLNQRIEQKDGTPVRSFDASFPFGQLKCLSADGRYALASKWRDCYLIDLANGAWTERDPGGNPPDATGNSDASKPKLSADDHAKPAEWFPDDVLLGAELKLTIQETAEDWRCYYRGVAANLAQLGEKDLVSLIEDSDGETAGCDDDTACEFPEFSPDMLVAMRFPLPPRATESCWLPDASRAKPTDHFSISRSPGCVLLSPDGRFLLSDYRSTSQCEANVDRRVTDLSGSVVPLKKQFIAATVTDFSNWDQATGDHLAIEGPRRMLAVTRDGAAVVFTGDSDRPADRDGDRLTFWGIELQDWLPENECPLNSQFSGTVESPYPPLHPGVLQSPDGRVILLKERGWGEHFLVRLNGGHKRVLAQRRWKYAYSVCSWFSPDGKYLVQIYEQQTAYLWNVANGECIGVVEMPEQNISDPRLPSWIDCNGVLRDDRGRDVGIRIDESQRGPAWVTGARLFNARYADDQNQGPKMCIGDSWEVVREGLSGRYDKKITFLCPAERKRIELPDKVIKAIDEITKKYHFNVSPVLDYPDEAWDDEPGLDFDCPKCGQKLRSTPFYVDRQKATFNANSDTSR